MSEFDDIRPFYDSEVNAALSENLHHPMMRALMEFIFPNTDEKIWHEKLLDTHSIRDFQINFAYKALKKVLHLTSDGLSTSGFEKLNKNTAYLFISNHRDIILDTSLLNVSLHDHQLLMTASAIGDNLVQKQFLLTLSKLNRNFLVKRGLNPREMLQSSKLMSQYIAQLLLKENRSVWIAQREGRTKDGNDATQTGVLKMIAMASDEENIIDYLKKLKIVPVSISYQYDPTDALKMPQLMAQANDEIYTKAKNEDFNTLMNGIMGTKKHIHIHVGEVIDNQINNIKNNFDNTNKQIQELTAILDQCIIKNYKLWNTNYIAYDLLHQTNQFAAHYKEEDKQIFERRMAKRIDVNNELMKESFLAMYANPVVNQLNISKNQSII
jgi:1-acyl-sn-glycerol-3-phosphate acyltransferase